MSTIVLTLFVLCNFTYSLSLEESLNLQKSRKEEVRVGRYQSVIEGDVCEEIDQELDYNLFHTCSLRVGWSSTNSFNILKGIWSRRPKMNWVPENTTRGRGLRSVHL